MINSRDVKRENTSSIYEKAAEEADIQNIFCLRNEVNMNKNRITYLDFAKGIGIIFVVYGHIEYISEGIRGFISSFHMPLFFIISGMLISLKNEDKKNFIEIIKKKANGILTPYMFFSIIYFFIDIMNLYLHKIDLSTFIENGISSVTLYGVSVLWFLPALFIGETVALFVMTKIHELFKYISNEIANNHPVISSFINYLKLQNIASGTNSKTKSTSKKLAKTDYIFFVICLLICLFIAKLCYLAQLSISVVYDNAGSNILVKSFVNFVRVFLRGGIASLFVTIGFVLFPIIESINIFKSNKEDYAIFTELKSDKPVFLQKLKAKLKIIKEQINLPALIIGIILLINTIAMAKINGCVDFHYIILKNTSVFYTCAVIGSLAIILISKGLPRLRLIEYFGQNSLIIMSTHVHCYILYIAILLSWQVDAFITHAKGYIFMFNIMLFTFLIEIAVIEIINRFFPFILGKKMR